jgi:hypothetical protein
VLLFLFGNQTEDAGTRCVSLSAILIGSCIASLHYYMKKKSSCRIQDHPAELYHVPCVGPLLWSGDVYSSINSFHLLRQTSDTRHHSCFVSEWPAREGSSLPWKDIEIGVACESAHARRTVINRVRFPKLRSLQGTEHSLHLAEEENR